MKKKKKGIRLKILLILLGIILITGISTGFFEKMGKTITGHATDTIILNITVGGPEINYVLNASITDFSTGPNQGPSNSDIIINFSVYNTAGIANLNHTTAKINFSRSNELTRENASCTKYASSLTNANYSCNISMWWWDGAGTWDITAYIEDNNTNVAQNKTTTFQIGETTSFNIGPNTLTWSAIAPGATNQTSTNDPILLNNTGNKQIGLTTGNITINATNLRGESNSELAIWAGNFSVNWKTGSEVECDPTTDAISMSAGNYINISGSNLTKGNYSLNDGTTGQEQLYVCMRTIGSELTSQSYSTANESTWTVQIT